VPLGLRVRVVSMQDGSAFERTFDRSPVRIGRNPLNELQIQTAFVSQFHAVLEFDDTHIMLRDLGSTNGTALRASGRMQPNRPVDLTSQNFEFAIVSLWFQLFFVSAPPPRVEQKREGTILSLNVSELHNLMRPSVAGAAPQVQTGPDRTPELLANLRPAYEEYRAAWAKVYRELFASVNPLEPAARQRFLERASVDLAAMQHEGDFQRLSAYFGGSTTPKAKQSHSDTTRDEAVALQALRDLAAGFVPQRGQLERVVDLVMFAQKVQDLLGVFFKCFLALRDGHKQFKTQMDIRRTKPTGEQLSPALAVEVIADPRELASRVLDWTDPTNEGSRAIESTFAEIMVHQVAMLSGVMRGVRSLLAKLAPQSIEAELENPRRKNAGGIQLGPFRYKTLWELYSEIYGDFAEDEKQAFALIFGSEFASAYSELAQEAVPAAAHGMPPHALPFAQPKGPPGPYGPPPYGSGPPAAQTGPQPRGSGSGYHQVAPPPMVPQPPAGPPPPGASPVPPPPPWAGPSQGGSGPPRR
jgi:type VI secretion system protein ImpI